MTNPQLVRIPTPGKDKAPLSKGQQEFNRLTQKIGQLEVELAEFRMASIRIQQRIYTEYEPLLHEYNKHRASLVRLFDRAYQQDKTTRTDQKKLADLILTIAYDLISKHGMEELKPLVDKYDAAGYDAVSGEKFMAYVHEQMQAKQEDAERRQQEEAAERQSQKPKTAKQQAREEKKQVEQRNSTKAVRTLYMDLVKAFHPDREPDEAEKSRKTEIMQRVTQAYQTSDLLALFRLQLEFDRIDQQHLETLADDQLKYYNKILRQQSDELSDELYGLQSQLAVSLGKPLRMVNSVLTLDFSFNTDLRELKKTVKAIKKDVKDLADPGQMKAFLKAYRIQKETDIDPFGTIFG